MHRHHAQHSRKFKGAAPLPDSGDTSVAGFQNKRSADSKCSIVTQGVLVAPLDGQVDVHVSLLRLGRGRGGLDGGGRIVHAEKLTCSVAP